MKPRHQHKIYIVQHPLVMSPQQSYQPDQQIGTCSQKLAVQHHSNRSKIKIYRRIILISDKHGRHSHKYYPKQYSVYLHTDQTIILNNQICSVAMIDNEGSAYNRCNPNPDNSSTRIYDEPRSKDGDPLKNPEKCTQETILITLLITIQKNRQGR